MIYHVFAGYTVLCLLGFFSCFCCCIIKLSINRFGKLLNITKVGGMRMEMFVFAWSCKTASVCMCVCESVTACVFLSV